MLKSSSAGRPAARSSARGSPRDRARSSRPAAAAATPWRQRGRGAPGSAWPCCDARHRRSCCQRRRCCVLPAACATPPHRWLHLPPASARPAHEAHRRRIRIAGVVHMYIYMYVCICLENMLTKSSNIGDTVVQINLLRGPTQVKLLHGLSCVLLQDRLEHLLGQFGRQRGRGWHGPELQDFLQLFGRRAEDVLDQVGHQGHQVGPGPLQAPITGQPGQGMLRQRPKSRAGRVLQDADRGARLVGHNAHVRRQPAGLQKVLPGRTHNGRWHHLPLIPAQQGDPLDAVAGWWRSTRHKERGVVLRDHNLEFPGK
eukprot:5011039-Lingulodinium_polyedra.AAC.1